MTEPISNMVCATCQQPLNRWLRDGHETWTHPRMDADHEAVPIPRSDATGVQEVCDFCGGDDVVWVYATREEVRTIMAAERFTDERDTTRVGKDWEREANRPGQHADLMQNRFSKKWTACAKCSAFIEIPDMERLITHIRRFAPEVFGRLTRTLLRQHFTEFFRLKEQRRPLGEPGGAEPSPGTGHKHALSDQSLPPDPDGLAVDLALIDELVGAAIDACLPCQSMLLDRVVADPVTTYGLIDLALRSVDERLGGVPHTMLDDGPRETGPGWLSLGFRRVATAADGGRNRRAAADVAGRLSPQERATAADEALNTIAAVMP